MSASTVLAVPEQTSKPSRPTRVPASPCNLSIGYLVAFIVLLVVAHHAILHSIRAAAAVFAHCASPHLAVRFNPLGWSACGPFTFPTSRALHSLVYFFLGMGIGAYGLERGFLACDGKLRRRWWLRCVASLVAFAVGIGVGIAAMTVHLRSRAWEIAGDSAFVLSCAASSFAFVALFVRFAGKRRPILDSLQQNAYGIYLVHSAFVSWMQLALLKLELPAMVKAAMIFVSAGLLSWGTVALIRRIPLGQLVRRGA
jgi:surface polysaccharide O-acyltransferase-like enzyme